MRTPLLAAMPSFALAIMTASVSVGAQTAPQRPRPAATSLPIPRIPDTAIDANIDASITGTTRQMLRATMKALRQQDRQNVVILAPDGNLYANHTALLNHIARGKPVSGNARRFVDRRGHQYVTPGFDRTAAFVPQARTQIAFAHLSGAAADVTPIRLAALPPDGSGTTGPYRRIYSNPGFSFAQGMITLPCGNSNLQAGVQSAETGYVYTGGFSDGGDQVDAGLQYSAYSGNYSMYMSRLHATGPPMTADEFNCGQNVSVAFYAATQTKLVLNIQGTFNGSPNYSYTFSDETVTSSDGWNPTGGQMIMKRMTTIAQDVQNFTDQSYFAYGGSLDPASIGNSPQMGLYNWSVGTSYDPALPNPGQTWAPINSGPDQRWPDDSTKVQTAQYSNGAGWDEFEGILLHS